MNVKQWLGRARYIDLEISALEQDRKIAVDRLTRITQSYDSDGAQTSPDPHKFDRLAEYDEQIQQKSRRLFFYGVFLVDIPEQKDRGNNRCAYVKNIIEVQNRQKEKHNRISILWLKPIL